MNILIVGGSGMIGGHCATFLQTQGHHVTVAARNKPMGTTPMAAMTVLLGDYTSDDFKSDNLARFDAIVFAAGNDIRHVAEGVDPEDVQYWERVNAEAIPAFAAKARTAGVERFVYIGSFYPQVAPYLIDQNAYVRSRHLADVGVRALANDAFHVCCINAPFVVGCVPGLSIPMFEAYTAYAQGKLEGVPVFGPAGGSNFISTLSLAEAVDGALKRGESGKAYLVGDENLTFSEYFREFFRAAGNDLSVDERDEEHPLLPDAAILTGRGSVVSYEVESSDSARLGFRRSDVRRAIQEVVDQYTDG
ncbi:MAG: NAD-dependent epimerase/dehydratase family protein [Pseudomonadota bacterium]